MISLLPSVPDLKINFVAKIKTIFTTKGTKTTKENLRSWLFYLRDIRV